MARGSPEHPDGSLLPMTEYWFENRACSVYLSVWSQFCVLADFPLSFSPTIIRRLMSMSHARAGGIAGPSKSIFER